MTTPPGILDLPVELLLQVLSYLDLRSFLSLTSTCQALHKSEYLNEPAYWSHLVRNTFRVANQPVIEHDGARWKTLYKRLLTQSEIYTWGNNVKGCLGHSHTTGNGNDFRVLGGRGNMRRRPHVSWPELMVGTRKLGVVSDLQCGGWSTTILTAKGVLYTVGVMNGLEHQQPMLDPVPLQYPPGFPPPLERYEASTAIRQFSAGRSHVLALADSGKIWSWSHAGRMALCVRFLNHDTVESGKLSGKGAVKKVVAGWNKSGALIEGSGIVVWEPLKRDHDDTSTSDAALVLESAAIPKTDYRRTSIKYTRHDRSNEGTQDDTIGEVLNFVILDQIVLFNTHLGKAFVSHIRWDQRHPSMSDPVELPLSSADSVTDVQGSFQSFAIFTSSGAVLTSKQERLLDHLSGRLPAESELFTRIPALQNKNVIQLAFGDYHFHALHSPGYITSYGTEPQHCGALGLGGPGGEGRLRGMRYQNRGDARLVPHAYTEGRRVWFLKDKRRWLEFLISGGKDPGEGMERMRMALGMAGTQGMECQGEVSEWIEQEGRDWESRLLGGRENNGNQVGEDDRLGAHFALSVSAAGWHSGALVLVNEEVVAKMRDALEVPEAGKQPVSEDAEYEDPSSGEASGTDHNDPSRGAVMQLVDNAASVLSDYGRWFLGLPPYDPPAHADNQNATESTNGNFLPGMNPMHYGASPRAGVNYIWAEDHFPRLVLRDGTVMPGSVDIDKWRFGRPEWDLNVEI